MDELKALYLRLSKQAHPDAGPEPERPIRTMIMQQINTAYTRKDIATLQRLEKTMPGQNPPRSTEVEPLRENQQERQKTPHNVAKRKQHWSQTAHWPQLYFAAQYWAEGHRGPEWTMPRQLTEWMDAVSEIHKPEWSPEETQYQFLFDTDPEFVLFAQGWYEAEVNAAGGNPNDKQRLMMDYYRQRHTSSQERN